MAKLEILCVWNLVIIATIFNYTSNTANVLAFPTNKNSGTPELRKILLLSRAARLDDAEHSRTKRQLNIIQSKIVDIVQPKPIVDTLREEDKYGNMVDHAFGKSIVKAVENLSQVINSIFAFPVNTVKKVSKAATDALNNIGGKLVGLQ